MTTATLQVHAIGWTHFEPPTDVPWTTDATGGQALAEFAGRACYQSWNKPNPNTATNAGYLTHILDVGHLSVLEHGTATFYLTGVSRALTHELIRHRHLSVSQLSQRYVTNDGTVIEPPIIAGNAITHHIFTQAVAAAQDAYEHLTAALDGTPIGRKAARQAARSVLPNATETRIIITGNYRAWRHFINLRATPHADVEIRAAAIAILHELQQIAPNVYSDYITQKNDDGTTIALSAYTETP